MEHVLRAHLLICAGKTEEAIGAFRKTLEIEPLLPAAWSTLAALLADSRRLPEARGALARALEIAPDYSDARFGLGMTSLLENDPKAALAEFEKVTLEHIRFLGVAIARHALGRPKESQRALDALIAGYAVNSAYQIALVYARRGERDKAFEWFDRAYAQRDAGLATIQWGLFFCGFPAGRPALRGAPEEAEFARPELSYSRSPLAAQQERFRESALAADLEGAEVLEPGALGSLRLRFSPRLELIEILDGDLPVAESIEQVVAQGRRQARPLDLRH